MALWEGSETFFVCFEWAVIPELLKGKTEGGGICALVLKADPPPLGVTFRVMTHAKIVCQQFSFYFNFSLSLNPPFLSFVLVFFIFIFLERKSYSSLVRFFSGRSPLPKARSQTFFGHHLLSKKK